MTLEILIQDMYLAMKNRDVITKGVLASAIDAVKKAAIDNRAEINETLVNEVLVKEQKTLQEQIDTCPADRVELAQEYNAKMAIIKQYAPQLTTDPAIIRESALILLNNLGIEISKANRGQIMKMAMPHFKGKADMKIVNQVINELLN